MKCLIVTALVLMTLKVSAQNTNTSEDTTLQKQYGLHLAPGLPLIEAVKHLGENVYIRYAIAEKKLINDSLTILYLGGNYPDHTLSIIIKGKELNTLTASWWNKHKIGHFHGIVILYEGKPAIIITSHWQLGTAVEN